MVINLVIYYTSAIDIRSVSGHLVRIPDWGNILLDAGEGTWGQMARYFGTDGARHSNVWQALRELKCVFVSHVHADHHTGLAKILAMRKQVLSYYLQKSLSPSDEYNSSTLHLPIPFTLSRSYPSIYTSVISTTWKTSAYRTRPTHRTALFQS